MCSALSDGFACVRLVAGFSVLTTSSAWTSCPTRPTTAIIKIPIVIEQKGGIFCFYEKHVSHLFLESTCNYLLLFSFLSNPTKDALKWLSQKKEQQKSHLNKIKRLEYKKRENWRISPPRHKQVCHIPIYLCYYNYINYLKNLSKFQKLHSDSIKYHHFEE